MIPFDFDYYKPENIEEAVKTYADLKNKGKKPLYYGGGTEIISMSRTSNIYTDAVIDLKGISECRVQKFNDNKLIIGSAVTLTEIAEANFFPLLALTVERIADHTIQDKITLGGNISETIIYKEALLPLLISNTDAVVADSKGLRQIPLRDIFDKKLKLKNEEFIVSFVTQEKYPGMPYLHAKRTKSSKINYPLITLAAIKDNNRINIAFSGLCRYPFRSNAVESWLNDRSLPANIRICNITRCIPDLILGDLEGSADYRRFLLEKMLAEVIKKLEE